MVQSAKESWLGYGIIAGTLGKVFLGNGLVAVRRKLGVAEVSKRLSYRWIRYGSADR